MLKVKEILKSQELDIQIANGVVFPQQEGVRGWGRWWRGGNKITKTSISPLLWSALKTEMKNKWKTNDAENKEWQNHDWHTKPREKDLFTWNWLYLPASCCNWLAWSPAELRQCRSGERNYKINSGENVGLISEIK